MATAITKADGCLSQPIEDDPLSSSCMNPGQFFVATWNGGTRLFRFIGWKKNGDALCVNYDGTNQRWGNALPKDGTWFRDGADLTDTWIKNLLTDEEARRTYGDYAVKHAPNAAPATQPQPVASSQPGLGDCEYCGDDEPAVGTYPVFNDLRHAPKDYPLCADCLKSAPADSRKRLLLKMSATEICGRGWSWKNLSDHRRFMDTEGESDLSGVQSPETPDEIWTKPSYIDALKEQFLANPNLQSEPYVSIVREQVAKLEAKLAEIVAKTKKEKLLPTTAIVKAGHDTASCPDKNLEVSANTLSLDQADAMSEAELHDGVGLAIARGAAAYRSFCNLMTVVKRRLNEGKIVGGYRTLKAYVEAWVMLPDESFDAAIRKVYRAIADDAKDGRRTGRPTRTPASLPEPVAEPTPAPIPETTVAVVRVVVAAEPQKEIQTTVAVAEIEPQPQPAPATTSTTLTDEQREKLRQEYDALWEEGEKIPYADRTDEHWAKLDKLEEQLFGKDDARAAANGNAPKEYDLPTYTVTLHAKSITSMKAQLKKLGIEADVKKIVHVSSRADRLAEAGGNVQDAKSIVEGLRDELQDWLENLPENLQGGNKASELEDAISSLEDISSELDNIAFDVQFPGMY